VDDGYTPMNLFLDVEKFFKKYLLLGTSPCPSAYTAYTYTSRMEGMRMPSWLRNQLLRAFQEKDRRSIVMLNRIFYKYRNNQTLMSQQS
jgi:hypothetical protein